MRTSDNHAFVEVGDGALLLDLASGDVFELNESAAVVWRLWLKGEPTVNIQSALVARYGILGSIADDCIGQALASATDGRPRADRASPFTYAQASNGYVQSLDGDPILEVDAAGDLLRRSPAGRTIERRTLKQCVYGIAPKLLALRGHTVLHASAVSIGGRAMVFSGKSGAGKTTTARALVSAGASPISEDKVVLQAHGAQVRAVLKGESALLEWVARTAMQLHEGHEVGCRDLDIIAQGETAPLGEIGLIDADRRVGHAVATTRLAPLRAAGALFGCVFHGADTRDDWTRQLTTCATIGREVPTYELGLPDGTESLSGAMARLAAQGRLTSG